MRIIIILFSIVFLGCISQNSVRQKTIQRENIDSGKIQVLNMGFFHFGYTSDATSVDFDENDAKRQEEVRKLSQLITRFKPTIICLEYIPEMDEKINQAFQNFLQNPKELNTKYGELSMVGFDVARMSGLNKVYGIDNHMDYNYSVGDFIENSEELTNSIDPETYVELTNNPFKGYPEIEKLNNDFDNLPLLEKIKLYNDPIMLDYFLNTNADKLFYVGIENEFNGADQAAIFYQRNMRIYSNLNRIKMTKNDRVLILMGTAHTAMLREFIKRSPKFEMVNTLDFLK
ncbi:DUF5694 domain-containing protein [Maribacter algicola]|uniref:DUF5694 domain-containing protein n=1 Tax=Meishania litoralis TaxID=3434685 RepID=A0ACC7LNE6_9FLAO